MERWFNSRETLQPARRLALLCGHPRSGTTLLEQALDAHPDIVTAEETHILHDEAYLPLSRGFAPDAPVLEVLESAPASALQQSRESYFRYAALFLGKAIGDKLLIDKNPALNVLIPAVVRIFPEARFLVAIRDPRDVCLSCFMQPLVAESGQFGLFNAGRHGDPICVRHGILAGDAAQTAQRVDRGPLRRCRRGSGSREPPNA